MNLSSRIPRDLRPTAFSQWVEQRRSKVDFLDLTLSNPTRCGFDYRDTAWRASLASPEILNYFADPQGSLSVRESIAAHCGHDVQAEDILLTASTSEAYSWLFKLLCDPGDAVLVPSPSYPLFDHLAALEGLRAINVPAYFHERWCLDVRALKAACEPRTRAVIVVNPNNPTGQFLSKPEWRDLTEFCASHDLSLLVDEVFADFALEPGDDALRTALLDPNPPCPVFVLSGLSKVALLPQIKLGWIVMRGPAREYLDPLSFIADQYLSVSASAQAVASAALKAAPLLQDQVRARAHENLRCLDELLKAHPHLSRLPVEGGWSVLLRRPAIEDDETYALRLLTEKSVLVHPGHFFDLPLDGFLVMSLITHPDIFREGLERILGTVT